MADESGEGRGRKRGTLTLSTAQVILYIPAIMALAVRGNDKALAKLEDIMIFIQRLANGFHP